VSIKRISKVDKGIKEGRGTGGGTDYHGADQERLTK